MPQATMIALSVEEAATVLGVAPRTVRRWLQDGDLIGKKIGTIWVVLLPEAHETQERHRRRTRLTRGEFPTLPLLRQRLRQLGHQLIAVGNSTAGAQQKRGEVFLTWRRPGGLQILFVIGRASPVQGWAPHALGSALPFWLTERQRWRQIRPLRRRYEQLRIWCHPRLLRIPQVRTVIEAELHRLQAAVEACAVHEAAQEVRQT
jgi:excisionase family DNA binding protein